jgi:hypothetical protein
MEKEIGVITHFYGNLNVAVVKLNSPLKKGDKIKITGHSTNLKQKVESMQIDHKAIDVANKDQEIGLKVEGNVKEKDLVFMV